MEVYSTVREPARRGSSPVARGVGRVAVVTVAALFVVVALRFTFGRHSAPAVHNYGVVHTAIGIAAVACGGEVSDGCGDETTLRFASCSAQFHGYFDGADPKSVDDRVRALTGARPPSGTRWTVQCGGADAMINGQPAAHLEAN